MKPTYGIYVDIDSLLDTRFGVLAQMCTIDELFDIFKHGYLFRNKDEFYNVDTEIFKSKYESKSTLNIVHAKQSKVIKLIRDIIVYFIEIIEQTQSPADIVIELNINGYNLNDAEIDILIRVIAQVTSWKVNVKVINMPLNELNSKYISLNYKTIIMYDVGKWLNVVKDDLIKNPCKEIQVLTPAVWFGGQPSPEDTIHIQEAFECLKQDKNTEPFKLFEIMLSPYIDLKVIDIDVFSIDIPRDMTLPDNIDNEYIPPETKEPIP
jgi:hypothetical protein